MTLADGRRREPSTRPRCSVIIRAYNEEKHIGRLLTGIMQQTVRDVEIILVDSGSTDATVAIASRFPVRVVSIAPEAFTFGRSLNLGCSHAKGEFLVIASAHVYPVYPDWLECLLRPFEDPQVALAYGKQRGNAATRFSEHQVFAKWFPEEPRPRQRFPFCNNANAAVRRALWEQHPYDEDLPGLEDIDWATWALSQGYVLAYVPEAEVVHIHEETWRQVYNRYRREAMALRRIDPQAHFGLLDFLRLFPANVLADLAQAAREGVLWREAWGILLFRLMQFWGTYRGFSFRGEMTEALKRTLYYPPSSGGASRKRRRELEPIDYRDLHPMAGPVERAEEAERDG